MCLKYVLKMNIFFFNYYTEYTLNYIGEPVNYLFYLQLQCTR